MFLKTIWCHYLKKCVFIISFPMDSSAFMSPTSLQFQKIKKMALSPLDVPPGISQFFFGARG
jgi:hypothetical protein